MKDPSMWWLDRVAMAPFHLAQGRHWLFRVAAMVLGTPIMAVLLVLGFPLLMFDIARETFRDLGQPKHDE